MEEGEGQGDSADVMPSEPGTSEPPAEGKHMVFFITENLHENIVSPYVYTVNFTVLTILEIHYPRLYVTCRAY